ncbi:mandelate racemase/muconate lactonizing enzyme family protein [Endozoicomonas gorgoniicola]|uniref:Mandelate racemase/muconate lactonizing enzyme family protein n=1 Tax=Endozoicomonas gorgoniicola TaxID=1234144 RepID=A0ABT3N165_9GAMM|nr:mandelate racemase/muconate lactonizing enzyme family protein [Endozoicomonas gorgoniicola]MCW7555369.1 mandelate racemase/muconate lactonizing enzyme family protein [Endozoicomonas gorgoniicola]
MSKITKLEVLPVSLKSTNWDQSTVVIKITDENGVTGIGEADGPTETIQAYINQDTAHCWSQNFTEMLIGRDPLELTANWDYMYNGTIWQGARGLGLFAISGIDMALYDLAGKQVNKPAYKLLGGAQRDELTPYFTLYPSYSSDKPLFEQMSEWEELMGKAQDMGAKAFKLAIFAKDVSDSKLIKFIKKCREFAGDDVDMMVDFLYRWRDPYAASNTLNKLQDVDLYFAEAVLQHDHMQAHRILAENTTTRICGAEMATTRWECKQWIEEAKVAILQPDLNRAGGLTELRRIADMGELYGVQVMPHGWKTGISAAAGCHFQAAAKDATYFEFLHPELYDGPLRQHLVTPEPEVVDGHFVLPDAPGLGIELNEDFINTLH